LAYNLSSPTGILEPCDIKELGSWFARELKQVTNRAEKSILRTVAANLDTFVRWANDAVLLWYGCDRVPERGQRQKYFEYPDKIKRLAKANNVRLDGRPNGPAIASYLLAGGGRPERFGSLNAWSIHHLYSGKFPYIDREESMHATKHGLHFTQSAGLVAVHPVADAMVDEFPFFAWLLRAHSYIRFKYDPDRVFSTRVTKFGFSDARRCRVVVSAR
jgi:hypothetical protein